jgi:hypothetical protein
LFLVWWNGDFLVLPVSPDPQSENQTPQGKNYSTDDQAVVPTLLGWTLPPSFFCALAGALLCSLICHLDNRRPELKKPKNLFIKA